MAPLASLICFANWNLLTPERRWTDAQRTIFIAPAALFDTSYINHRINHDFNSRSNKSQLTTHPAAFKKEWRDLRFAYDISRLTLTTHDWRLTSHDLQLIPQHSKKNGGIYASLTTTHNSRSHVLTFSRSKTNARHSHLAFVLFSIYLILTLSHFSRSHALTVSRSFYSLEPETQPRKIIRTITSHLHGITKSSLISPSIKLWSRICI